MKNYERLTRYMQVGNQVVQVIPQRKERIQTYIDRLFWLEDKIESGELISTKEQGDNEIAFFVAHNAAVRRQTAIECLRILHALGGCGATDEYSKGWDEAIDTAFKGISEKFDIGTEEVLYDD